MIRARKIKRRTKEREKNASLFINTGKFMLVALAVYYSFSEYRYIKARSSNEVKAAEEWTAHQGSKTDEILVKREQKKEKELKERLTELRQNRQIVKENIAKSKISSSTSSTSLTRSYEQATSCTELLHKYRSTEDLIIDTDMLENQTVFRNLNLTERAKPRFSRFTDTDPPFHISLYSAWNDKPRWSIYQTGHYYEQLMLKMLQSCLENKKKGEVIVLDVGANIGWFSLAAASLGHYVYSFEPNVLNQVRLCESMELNNWITSENIITLFGNGVGETTEKTEFCSPKTKRNSGVGSFDIDPNKLRPNIRSRDCFPITIVNLDSIAEQEGWIEKKMPVAWLKVDVEGFETKVFRGAQKLLKSGIVQNIVFEYWPGNAATKEDVDAMMTNLYEMGYYLHKVGKDSGPDDRIKPPEGDDWLVKLSEICQRRPCNVWWKVKNA